MFASEIRRKRVEASRVGDLAMFDCAIDAKLRAYDLVRLRVSDVALGGAPAPTRDDDGELRARQLLIAIVN